jgi:predicted TIM-barrel fold metal-dependent hydrolase
MIVDFQHHFTPRELITQDPGDGMILAYDETGSPSYSNHRLLFDLDEHIRMMDEAGIDVTMLTSAAAMCSDLDRSRLVNDKAKQAERDYPGRFVGCAHAHPLGGAEVFKELARCKHELGYDGVVITSEMDGKFLDSPELDPFWAECVKLGLFVFVHPALKLTYPQQFDAYDMARSVGREYSLSMSVIRLINSGVFDRHPNLTVHMSHLGGGISSIIGRIRSYQDKDFWGTKGNAKHSMLPKKPFDDYIRDNIVFDTAGFCGAIGAVKSALLEIPAGRIVFATDYPQEIRARSAVRGFVQDIRALGADGAAILEGNVTKLLPKLAH